MLTFRRSDSSKNSVRMSAKRKPMPRAIVWHVSPVFKRQSSRFENTKTPILSKVPVKGALKGYPFARLQMNVQSYRECTPHRSRTASSDPPPPCMFARLMSRRWFSSAEHPAEQDHDSCSHVHTRTAASRHLRSISSSACAKSWTSSRYKLCSGVPV